MTCRMQNNRRNADAQGYAKPVFSVLMCATLALSPLCCMAAPRPAAAQEPAASSVAAASVSTASDSLSTATAAKRWADTATDEQAAAVVARAREAKMDGADALERYLAGKDLTAAELLGIDAKALVGIDKDLAKEITDLQTAAKADGSTSSKSGASDGSGTGSASTGGATGTSTPSTGSASVGSSAAASGTSSDAALSSNTDSALDSSFAATGAQESSSDAQETFTFTPNPTTEEFIASIGEQARDIAQKNDLYASVMIAQAILESGSGSSGLSKAPYYNLFGIKGSYQGQSVTMQTAEDDGTGSYYTIDSAFRRYPSTKESLEDYADLLTVTMASYYAPVHKSLTTSYTDACDYLQGHYATSTTYSAKLKGIIAAYNLTDYDGPTTHQASISSPASRVSIAWSRPTADYVDEGAFASPAADGTAGTDPWSAVLYGAMALAEGLGICLLVKGA